MELLYYIRNFTYNALPSLFFKNKYQKIRQFEKECDPEELQQRLDYYFKIKEHFEVPSEAVKVKDFKRSHGTGYYLDLKEFLHYFSASTSFTYVFGDVTDIYPYPVLIKARPIVENNANSILFKLNKRRHFRWVEDSLKFSEKKDMLVWRGGAYTELRKIFVEKYWNHPLCNIGQINTPKENVPWQKGFVSIKEQLTYKFIFSMEGNDVATNLKWLMSSNSLCLMPKPKVETWFMEGTLKAGVHYVEVNPPYDDLEEKIQYYTKHTDEAEEIIKNANQYVKKFQDIEMEDLLCLKVLERYAEFSNQANSLKFG